MTTNNDSNFGTGTAGQVLTSNGAGVSPTFQNAAASSAGPSIPAWVNASINTGYHWSLIPYLSGSLTTVTGAVISSNYVYLVPFASTASFTLTAMYVFVTARPSTDTMNFALYSMSSVDGSATLVASLGSVSVSGTNAFFGVTGLTQAASAGWYYAAIQSTSPACSYQQVTNATNTTYGCVYSSTTSAYSGLQYNPGSSGFPSSITAANLNSSLTLSCPTIFIRAY